LLLFFGRLGFSGAQLAQQALTAEAQHVLLFGVGEALPVEALIAAAHTAFAETALVDLANPPAGALDGEKLKLLWHTLS